ncbi:ATPase, T2SS/T4P/T4SS family [Micrococcus sp. 2A]|uniref:CpaF family protein n=1 Tax=unclassified Micrococcus TaxID=2620948 RepID=UPI00200374D8|nr:MULTISPECIES: ATPase, T2SS/T4P/T4SS family [unclassified Micrococcus]MCK6094506.1 Flp pilus assembly complex ATPase component TadA [Micrococcus sp. EYE_212]MCK6170687.1 Flp pilus assembly complex ATPase component TadA [Micrococcus sp. EYE_162]
MDAVRILEDEVREVVRRQGVDPQREGERVRLLIHEAVSDYESRSLVSSLPPLDDAGQARQDLYDCIAGLGPLQRLMDDPGVEEIWLNAPDQVYCARAGRSELTGLVLTEEEVRDLVEVMLKTTGRRLDLSMPFVDASLPDGSRLHVAIPDITRRHWAVNIRKFISRTRRLDDLVRSGSLSASAARFLDAAVDAGMNVLVSGATQAGKTTLLNCLAASIGPRERVITVEEIFELQIPVRDVVGLQCRQPNLEGHGEIPLRRLVKEALRMRPDRLIVGEVREAEALDMLVALNSGLAGMCTIHANSASDALTKLCTLPLLAGENISRSFVVPTVATCIDLVVHCERDREGRRRVREILSVGSRVEEGVIETSILFRRDREGDLEVNPAASLEFEALDRHGVDVHELLELR